MYIYVCVIIVPVHKTVVQRFLLVIDSSYIMKEELVTGSIDPIIKLRVYKNGRGLYSLCVFVNSLLSKNGTSSTFIVGNFI